ncbi:hypothetical protein D0C16_15790 [Cellvibrio sp. KY-GH-1]|uniref:DUF5329 domain-containing protein n=1 Tax=Cellvibrio sp. KY-GH-1 TaxID=2303332 RepID=UPI001243F108|nr:DUF5329 domain-containing protein [Cellvibrio sp. KY-GH-1]QEY17312.1 hypothetical protein D0C16_15790 [Cellvibrio sp. KY-GH-1]
MKHILSLVLLSLCFATHAEDLDLSTKQEIEHLFNYLKDSGCEFNRNGTWYGSSEAVNHLRKKYDYLVGKGMLTSSEAFIQKAASESSMSGKPYQVKCAEKEVVLSSLWFTAELKKYRNSHSR